MTAKDLKPDTLPVATGLALSAGDPVFRDRPHEVLDDLRTRDPVHDDRVFDRVVLTRAGDVRSVLADRGMSSDPRKSRRGSFSRVLLKVGEGFHPTMLHLDDPDHRRLRMLVSRSFNQRSVEALRPFVARLAGTLLDKVAGRDTFDVLADFAQPLSIGVIAHILGVDPGQEVSFAAWSDAQVLMFNPARTAEQDEQLHWAETELCRHLTDAVAARRGSRGTDLISLLVEAEEDGEQLTEAEVVDTCRLLLVAGNVTTRDLIGNGVVALLRHPAELARLRAEPGRIGSVVQELLRYDPPVTQAVRQTQEAGTIGGCPVAAGRSVVTLLMAANHDPALHTDPHAFNPDRERQRHFSFGGGAHFCLGAPLAVLEGEIALTTLFDRFSDLRLSASRPPRRKGAPSLNGFESVWIETGTAPSKTPSTAAKLALACDRLVAHDVLDGANGRHRLTPAMCATLAADAPQTVANTFDSEAASARMSMFARDGLALAFHEAGNDAAGPMVFIHGWGCDHLFLAQQQAFFTDSHRTVAVDLRGHGASGASSGDYAVGTMADDIAALCRALDLRRPVLIGHSMGGHVALECAARHPGLAAGIVAIDSALFPPAALLEQARLLVEALQGPEHRVVLPQVAAQLCQADHDPVVEAMYLRSLQATPPHVLATALAAHTIGSDIVDTLARCRCPVAYLEADAPLADMARLRASRPDIRTARISGAGHFAPLTMPQQVNAALAQLVADFPEPSQEHPL